jgi:SAM-dependent methyltransferase
MSGANGKTLLSYEARVQHYVDGTSHVVSGATKDWIDDAVQGLEAGARLVELGSAFGRDAAYIASLGFAVECTDAVPGFVTLLQARGFAARRCNVLTDALGCDYDLIFANAVLLHFDRGEFAFVLKKLRGSLKSGGRLAFSLKRGRGESWSVEKIGAPRFFCYWEPEDLPALLRDAGFSHWRIVEAATQRAHAEWLYLIAFAF